MRAYRFPHAAIATPHYLATAAGLHALLRGGSAADAVVAANLVLAVTCPHLCGVGGDLLAMVHAEGQVHGLNSSGRLPKAAELPGDGRVPQHGIGSVTVPGAAAGWVALNERFGRLKLKELAEPALRLAREGHHPSPNFQRGIERSRELLEKDPEARRLFLSGGAYVNPELADVMEDLEGFYTSPVAQNAPAPFRPEDFAHHEAEWLEPPSTEWQGHIVYEMPPNSRGHLVLKALETMGALDDLPPEDAEFHRRQFEAIEAATLSGDTVYLCAWDEQGMVVSCNESNYMGFGSGVVVPGTGVHLHNRGAYFTPDTYLGGEKPTHTLSPALALKEGQPAMAFGTMGGEAQVQVHLQLLTRILGAGQDPLQAVSAPRWVKHGRGGDLLQEVGLPDLGGTTIPRSDIAGHAHVILDTDEGLAAASDPRCDSLAAGY